MENKTTNSFTYTQPYDESHVSHDLSTMAMLFFELMCKQAEANKSYGELISTKNKLEQFGFTKAKNTKLLADMSAQMADYKKAADTLAFMESVWEKFGKDAMVVRYDQFFQILEKYDMVCGSFDRYLGGVPQFALDTLTRLNEMWERKELTEDFALGMNYAQSFTFSDEVTGVEDMKKHIRMPLRTANKAAKSAINNCTGFDMGKKDRSDGLRIALTDVLFIAAPAADMQPLKMTLEFYTEKLKRLRDKRPSFAIPEDGWFDEHLIKYGTLSIREAEERYKKIARDEARLNREYAAIEQAVKDEETRLKEIVAASDINRYAKIVFIHKEPEIVRILKDPFICSLTPYGVLIHTKWGAEAEDATIKRYEQLRDAIIGGAK